MNKNNFFNLSDDKLKFLLKHKDSFDRVSEKTDEKIISSFKNNKTDIDININPNRFKLVFAAVLLFLIIIVISSIIYFKFMKYNDELLISEYEINNDVKIIKSNHIADLKITKSLERNDLVKIESNSNLKLILEKELKINLSQDSDLLIEEVNKNNGHLKVKFFLKKGEIYCDLKLPDVNSYFTINTDTASFNIVGTKFNIKISDSQDIKIDVFDGSVNINNIIKYTQKTNIIREKANNLYNKIIEFKNKNITVYKGKSLNLNYEEIKNINFQLNNIINNINNKLIQNKYLLNEDNKLFENNLDAILNKFILEISGKNNENNNKTENKKNISKNYLIKVNSFNINLSELNTGISTDNENIYITNDNNKSIYCINPKNKKLLWTFGNNNIDKLNSYAIYFNDKIVIPATDKLYILNKNGSLYNTYNLTKGSVFWPKSIVYKNQLYIPTIDTIYKYDDNSIKITNDSIVLNGQIYFSVYNNSFFINAINEKSLFIYNFENNKLDRYAYSLKDRSFNSPLIGDGHIYISSIDKNLYKYVINDIEKEPIKIQLNNNIVSNIIYYKFNLFFILDNGYFYKINTNDFKDIIKIAYVENRPTIDKLLTKNLFLYKNKIYFSSDLGNVFCYDLIQNSYLFLDNKNEKNPFIGTPILCNETIYVFDIKSNLYKIID